jgi:hypothetical protein
VVSTPAEAVKSLKRVALMEALNSLLMVMVFVLVLVQEPPAGRAELACVRGVSDGVGGGEVG